MRMEDWNLRAKALDEVTLVTLCDGQNKQQALGFGCGRCACRGAAGADGFKSVSSHFSTPALCSFSSPLSGSFFFAPDRIVYSRSLVSLCASVSCYLIALSQPMVAAAG
jgi:hypothetical protein